MANLPATKKAQSLPAEKKSTAAEGGNIRVHESVVSSIARKAVLGTDGVVRFAGNSLVDNIAEFVGSKAIQDRAITVEMGDGTVSVEVQIVLRYGVYIPDVANAVQENIFRQLQDMTGMTVGKVNVVVMDIEEVQEETEETQA
jgi:uncharacterized alkaline shock family protein YloU